MPIMPGAHELMPKQRLNDKIVPNLRKCVQEGELMRA
jgi:hypothetical protein